MTKCARCGADLGGRWAFLLKMRKSQQGAASAPWSKKTAGVIITGIVILITVRIAPIGSKDVPKEAPNQKTTVIRLKTPCAAEELAEAEMLSGNRIAPICIWQSFVSESIYVRSSGKCAPPASRQA
jgi:hypothetical protein